MEWGVSGSDRNLSFRALRRDDGTSLSGAHRTLSSASLEGVGGDATDTYQSGIEAIVQGVFDNSLMFNRQEYGREWDKSGVWIRALRYHQDCMIGFSTT
jgi:hypothetical protein